MWRFISQLKGMAASLPLFNMDDILVFPVTVNGVEREIAVDVSRILEQADIVTEKNLENACREVAYDRILSFYIDDYDAAHQEDTIILDPEYDFEYDFQDVLGTHTDFYLMMHHEEIMQQAESLTLDMFYEISEQLWDIAF